MTITINLIIFVALFVGIAIGIFEYALSILKNQGLFDLTGGIGRKLINSFRLIFYFFIGIIALGFLGINIYGLLALAGFLGIILGLALQNTISNWFSGIYLFVSKLVREGQLIKVSSLGSTNYIQGIVHHVGFSHTEIATVDGAIKFIPNNLLVTSIIESGTIIQNVKVESNAN